MDEMEARLAALELLVGELLSRAHGDLLADLRRSIRDDLINELSLGRPGEAHMIRAQAIQLLDEARDRHKLFVVSANER